jgi:hypothetical protein
MRETINAFKRSAVRFKFISAVMGLFLSGALLAFGTSAWYYGEVMDERIAAYERQFARLVSEVDHERTTNRNILIDLTDEVRQVADTLRTTSATAQAATTTARAAANVAQGAADNAPVSRIRVTEIPPEPVAPPPAPIITLEWIEP